MKFDNKKAILLIIVLVGAYYLLASKKPLSSNDYAKIIVSRGMAGTIDDIIDFDLGFLKVWAAAVKANNLTFDYNGKTYMTQGGRAKR